MDKNRIIPSTQTKEVMVALNEDSIRDRKKRVKSSLQIQQQLRLHLVTNKRLDNMVPDRKFDKHKATTKGNVIAFLTLPSYESMWSLPRESRIKVYGSRRVSGGDSADDVEPSADEPTCVFFHALPANLWQDIGAAFQAKGFLDLSAGSGEVAKAALMLRRPCLSICLSDEHQMRLMDHLVDFMQQCMLDQGNTFVNLKYMAFKNKDVKPNKPKVEPKPPGPDGEARKKRKPSRSRSRGGKKGKDEKKGKKGKKTVKESSSSSSSSSDSDS